MTLRNPRKTLAFLLGSLLVVLMIAYGIFQARNLIRGPKIELESPQNGETVADPLIDVKGKAYNISFISLNDRHIFIDPSGAFSEKLLLFPGYNVLTLKAEDKFGRKIQKTLQVVHLEASTTAIESNTSLFNLMEILMK